MRRTRALLPAVLAVSALVPVTASAQPAAYVATQPATGIAEDPTLPSKAELPPPDDRLAPPPLPPLRRGWTVAVDTGLTAFTGAPFLFSVDARFGRRLNLGSYFVVPEAEIGALTFAGAMTGPVTGRLGGGARMGLSTLSIAETSLYSHAGVVLVDRLVRPYTDLGVALDLRAGHNFSVGAHLAWDLTAVGVGNTWAMSPLWLLGAHAGLVL
jgi:hypothetical protein